MKSRILLVVMLGLVGLIGNAQTPNWEWARNAIGSSNEESFSVATDANGNVFMTGFFKDTTITFGAFTLTNAVADSNTSEDIFIVKYDASGNVLWAKSAGGTADDEGISVATDASGNVLVTGYFKSPTITFGTTTLTNANANTIYGDIFIVKYDSNGNMLWAKSAGGTADDVGISVATDANENVFVTGDFFSPSITFGTFTLTNVGGVGFFIVKYDSSGTVIWAKSAVGNCAGLGISTDAIGNVFVSGSFSGTTITFDTFTLTDAGFADMFIVKYDSTGNVHWAKSAGGTSYDYSYSIATDASGNAFITGYFLSPSITFGSFTLTNTGSYDIFIVKYDSSGNVVWAKSADGTSYDIGKSVATDANGNVYLTGNFNSPILTFDAITLTNTGGADIFIVKYDSGGTAIWAKSAGGASYDYGNSISTDTNGSVYVAGYFNSPVITFGSTTFTNSDNTGHTDDIFIAKLNATTGIEEISIKQGISLSPNPFSTLTTLTLQGSYHSPTLFIYNLMGQEVGSIPVGTNNQITIPRNNLPAGMYFYKLVEENKEVLGLGKMLVE